MAWDRLHGVAKARSSSSGVAPGNLELYANGTGGRHPSWGSNG